MSGFCTLKLGKIMNGLKRVKHVSSNMLFILRYAFKTSPLFSLFMLVSPLVLEIIVFIEHTYMISYLIDCIQYNRPFVKAAIFIVVVFTLSFVHSFIARTVYDYAWPCAEEKVTRAIRKDLYDKACKIDLKCYDQSEFYDDFVWAIGEANNRVISGLEIIGNSIGQVGSIFIIGGFIFVNDVLGIFVSVFSFISVLLVSFVINKKEYLLNNDIKPYERKADYISRVFYLRDYVKEIRISGFKDKLYVEYDASIDKQIELADGKTKKLVWLGFINEFVNNKLLYEGVYLIYIAYKAFVKSVLSYGTMVALFNAVQNMGNNLRTISGIFPQLQEQSLYIDKIRKFLDYDITISNGNESLEIEAGNTIKLVNVSFSYGGKEVLRKINMEIKPGEKIALVGYNGAGKSTLIKLLLRLYDPTDGEILYGGKNIKKYDVHEYRKLFGTVFQDFKLFATTIGNNIVADTVNINESYAIECLNRVGLMNKIEKYPNGLSTQVTKEFDKEGAEFSGGEAQKLAISRCLYGNGSIYIMDEPSSALDPLSEYQINDLILKESANKSVVIISHRLSTTKNVDYIYMLDSGEIIEQGTHDALMELGGRYSDMFNKQANMYAY